MSDETCYFANATWNRINRHASEYKNQFCVGLETRANTPQAKNKPNVTITNS